MTVALAVTLLGLTAAAVLGSWRQAVLLQTMVADSASTDAYQRAAYLAAREIGIINGVLREPNGEERAEAPEVGQELIAALDATAALDGGTSSQTKSAAETRRALQPVISEYFNQLDAGQTEAAELTLERRIEPVYEQILVVLLAKEETHVALHAEGVAQAQRESRVLQVGTTLAFMLGLVVLGLIGWSTRSHRRLVERMAAHDSLTGLYNRAAFGIHTELALTRAGNGAKQPSVLVLDLDGFKDVNDSLGHHIGDQLLTEVSDRLRGCVRPGDTIARLGGDEFAVLLTDADPGTGEQAASRITEALNRPFVIDGLVLDIEASIGIATAEPGTDVATVLRYAETAMYTAKEHRLGHTRFDPRHAHETADRLMMLGDLRRALDATDEMQLHYQPKISVETGEMIGAEALARWQHPTKGPIGPNVFIPVLEGTNLIHRFTAHVLDMALAQTREWLDAGHRVPVAVNVSTRCLLDATFADTVARALAEAGISGDLLCIEITENTVMADPERAIEVLRKIRALGVRTAIDDFGTGYSSMAYLRILPVDEIKVDRSFVRDMATDRSNYVLVESAVDLGHNLGLAVVAEGVENEPIVAALQTLGCDVAQGYHFARPLPPADFAVFLSKTKVSAAS